MAERTARPAGSIYDLGYRSYQGPRLGRRYAILSLYVYSLRSIFGLGRSWQSKFFPIGLALVAMVPALVQLAIAAIAPADLEFIAPEDYFGYVSIVLALFCAVAAPEIIGRDQRTRTLSLYFSRALSRMDYALAKLLALLLALFLVLFTPQVILLLGEAVADDDLVANLRSNADLLPPILAASVVASIVMGSLALAIASQTSRRAFSTGAVLAYFVIFTALGGILLETLSGDARGYALLVSPVHVVEGAVYWLFSTPPPPDSDLSRTDVDPALFFGAACVYGAVAVSVYLSRIRRLAA